MSTTSKGVRPALALLFNTAFFFSNDFELVAKDFEVDDGLEFRQKVVDLVDFVELVFQVEESELSFVFGHES